MRRWLLLALLAGGCATPEHPPPAAQAAALEPPLPRSSIAAVLAHAGELRLTADQVNRLRELDDNLQKAQAALQGRGRAPAGQPSNGAAAGMGGRRMGGRGGRRGGGMHPVGSDANAESRRSALEEKRDSQDTEAYLHAEELLTPEQQPRARAIAERYREQLWDRRQAQAEDHD